MQEIQISGIKQKVSENEVELSMDIFEAEDTIFIIIPLAGINAEQVKIHLSEDVLTISGIRDIPDDIAQFHSKRYFIEECHWGKFSRSVVLPEVVHSANIRATSSQGILRIIIPKAKKVHEKDIPVEQYKLLTH